MSLILSHATGRGRRSLSAALLAFVLLIGLAATTFAQSLDKLEIAGAAGVHTFSVEVVADQAGRERGLMYRRFMPQDRGMLFDFKQEAPVSFWMKNTYIPLDMIFISRRGVVTKVVANAEPLSERQIPSGGPVWGVLEVNGGVAARLGVKPGDRVKHPIFKP